MKNNEKQWTELRCVLNCIINCISGVGASVVGARFVYFWLITPPIEWPRPPTPTTTPTPTPSTSASRRTLRVYRESRHSPPKNLGFQSCVCEENLKLAKFMHSLVAEHIHRDLQIYICKVDIYVHMVAVRRHRCTFHSAKSSGFWVFSFEWVVLGFGFHVSRRVSWG